MAKLVALANLKIRQTNFIQPNIRSYNRLEGNPRSKDFDRSLRMEVRDAMWFLCRQWQFGEFQGEDTGTAYQANILGVHSTPERIILANGSQKPYDISAPLEMVIEQEAVDATVFLRAQMGRHFGMILEAGKLQKYLKQVLEKFPLDKAVSDDDTEGLYLVKSMDGRIPDGYKIYAAILDGSFQDWVEHHSQIAVADFNKMSTAADAFVRWFQHLYQQPQPEESAWVPQHLEYNFSLESKINAGKKRTLIADQYASGHLDWKDFDQVQTTTRSGLADLSKPEEHVQTFIPTQLKFSGMPHPRLWQLEDSETDFGKIDSSPTSILNLLLAEYGLTYSNDWFVLPYELEINTLCEIQGIRITDVFGQHHFVGPTIDDPEMNWQQFVQFHQTERDNATINKSIFYLVPAVGRLMEGEDFERVNFIRDEMSNMVWAIEQIVPSDAGKGRDLKRHVPSLADFEPADEESKIRYVLGNTVPDNWIPFIAVHKPVSPGEIPQEIHLQRAKMPESRGPQSKVVSEVQPVYFIEEEEVPRAGIIINRNFQRTRWLNGKTCLWLGRRKRAGRGEGSANLMFDQLVTIRKDDP